MKGVDVLRRVITVAAVLLSATGCAAGSSHQPVSVQPRSSTAAGSSPVTTAPSRAGLSPLHVSGNRLLDAEGNAVRLLGVNRSGTEDACAGGGGYAVFDGPADQASVAAMKSWHINAVRVPLNEQCWLAVRGTNPAYTGRAYASAISRYVQLLNRNGLYAILDLHVATPSPTVITPQLGPLPDAVHSIPFWRSVAAAFRGVPGVVFDLYNEPYGGGWDCWRAGCDLRDGTDASGRPLPAYRTAGMQQLVGAVRSAGAKQVVMVAGLGYANDLSGWLAHRPDDPTGNLAAAFHVYPNPDCTPSRCDGGVPLCAPADCAGGKGVLARLAKTVPVVVGEVGEYDCAHRYVDPLLEYFDGLALSYLGWTWNAGGSWTCKTGPTLITGYDGTPTPYGKGLRDHLARLAAKARE